MSEKAACPKCDSYVSQVYYDHCHEWCGWNCRIVYELDAWGPRGHMEFTSEKEPPGPEVIAHMADAVGCDVEGVHVTLLVNGRQPDKPLSAWLDPEQDTPKPLSERKRRANLKELRDRIARDAVDRAGL